MSPKEKMQLLKFGASWCPACAALTRARTIEEFAELHPDVKVVHLNINRQKASDIADEYNVRAIPSILFCDSKGNALNSVTGLVTLSQLEKAYRKARDKNKSESGRENEDEDEHEEREET